MKIALATDHAGFEQLQTLKAFLESLGHQCVDYGPKTFDLQDDYPNFMFSAAKAVASGECERGIIYGGSGQGEAMAANRLKGVRCALFYGPVTAVREINAEGDTSTDPYVILNLSREHNDANMLSLAARFLTMPEMQAATRAWLEAPGATAERHLRRVAQLDSQGS